MTVQEKLEKLRAVMAERGIDAYLVPTDDFHSSEYVGEYFKCREYISGFTGSAGTVLVTQNEAGLWTDGRYFLQAEAQLKGSGIDLYKMGEPKVPDIKDFLINKLPEHGVLGFDGRTINAAEAKELEKALSKKGIAFSYEEDLIGKIWDERPELSKEKAWILPLEYAGESRESKLKKVRREIADKGADALVITSLDDIAWLFNFRGNDVECNPVVLSYAYISDNEALLFTDEEKFSGPDRDELAASGIDFLPYNYIYEFVKEIKACGTCRKKKVLMDDEKVNYTLVRNLEKSADIVYGENPTALLKAVKNETEIANMSKTHLKDGVSVIKLIYWLKNRDKEAVVTELDVVDKLEELRSLNEGYLGPSFGTIAGYGANGAIIHYSATPESNTVIGNKGFILVDTGGTYMGGTTDVTRTIAAGALTDEEKRHYTAVLKGHLNLAGTRFPEGAFGFNLDGIARRPIWDVGCDYKHGTGHGVGYMLNVHEGPNSIRSSTSGGRSNRGILKEGMITSNEPGIYIARKHGIRIETLLLCVREPEKTDVPMLKFETLTLVPYEREGILPEMLTEDEKKQLNEYHARVYNETAPFLTEEEKQWLKLETMPI